jgi:hypothetical protein
MATVEAMLDGLVDQESDEDWKYSYGGDLDSRMESLRVGDEKGRDGADEQSFEKQMLRVSMELTEVIRGMMRFVMDADDETQSDDEVMGKERVVSERFKKLRLAQLKVRAGRQRKATERVKIVLAVDKQVKEVMENWKWYCGEKYSSLTHQDIFPWKVIEEGLERTRRTEDDPMP